ncbi:cardiolipin synthase [Romboutsia lituseburensis]|uniref:Cardiolipin synthase n=1 Tax=Romboutsia lituseburensis DSM 797 TaxID=1121325 RepID=A0A1G9RLM1_9FIRM|nr:cardiolipin synthase [Romboutsia lituseburensis]CEH32730.1 Cardiolipin synthase [Romboutsia lituseburensis]SDM23315.1 cardiolipin synthase [Romboutsia lituseburensis DSM 797]
MIDLSFFKGSGYEILGTAVYIINFLVILNLIFREKRSIETTVAWILILSTIPALGFILYFSFGRGISKDNMFKIKEAEDKIIKNNILDTHVKLESANKFEPNVVGHRDMIYALANSNNAHFTDNNTVDIYPESSEFFDSLLDELKKAKKYINIQFYIFKDDEIGSKILNILLEKAKEGVEVRLLYDAVGSRLFSDKTILKLKKNGVKIGAFFPSFMKIVNFNLNYRNHRKIVVIDGNVGFVGGNNVGDEYLGKDPKFGNWRDTHLRLTGDCVRDLNIRFILDWRYTTKENLELDKYFNDDCCVTMPASSSTSNNVGVQIVSSGPDITELDEIKYGYIKMIQGAKKYVYIQSPYFILDRTLTDTLKIACLSGVDVRIMIPSKPDHPFVYWASCSYAGELLKFGAKVYTYDQGSFLHAKTVVMDDAICSIGTANMDIRSFELNFEVNAFMYSSEVAKKQRLIFENDILNSKEMTLDLYNSRPTNIRMKESISRLLSPVL